MKLMKKYNVFNSRASQQCCKMLVLFVLFSGFLYANNHTSPELAEKELRGSGKVEFENRSNRLASQELRAEQVEHGKRLVRQILKTNHEAKDKEITLKRVYSNQDHKLGADILMIGKNAHFGHINGLLRLLSGYLIESFEYSSQEARMLSNIIIFYNAIIRQNVEDVKKRYAQSVVASLNPQHIGIDRNFSNWAGETEIIIPLYNNLVRPGGKEMNTKELRYKVEKDLDKESLESLDKTQALRRKEDTSRLLAKREQTKKRLQNEEQKYLDIEEQLRKEKSKPKHEQDLEKIKYLEQQKSAILQAIEKDKNLEKALHKQLAENSPTTTIAKDETTTLVSSAKTHSKKQTEPAKMSMYVKNKEAYVNSNTKFALTATDKSSAVDYTEYKIDNGKFKYYQKPFSMADEGKSKEGKYIIVYRSADVVGNMEADKSYLVIVDDSGPEISLTNKNKNNFFTKDGKNFIQKGDQLILFATDNLSGVKNIYYRINNADLQYYTKAIAITESGGLVIEYGAEDKLGNKTTDVFELEVDDKAPVVEVLYNGKVLPEESVSRIQRGKAFQLLALDNQSGVKQVLYRTNEQEKFIPFTKEIFFNDNGQHTIEVKAIDNVGNQSAVKKISFIQDDEPPKTILTPVP